MRYTGPKNRLSRRQGIDLGLKTPGSKAHMALIRRLNIPPGQHGSKGYTKLSERGEQLREKQKLRFFYGLTESQLKKYFKQALEKKGDTSSHLISLLESRLDNVVFRLGFAPTRAAARQLVTHGHICVNNQKVTIPSYHLKIGDEIRFRNEEKTLRIDYIKKNIEQKDISIPKWLLREGHRGKVVSIPKDTDIEKILNFRLIIDYYSR